MFYYYVYNPFCRNECYRKMNYGSMFLKKQFALMLSLFNYTDYYLICLYSM